MFRKLARMTEACAQRTKAKASECSGVSADDKPKIAQALPKARITDHRADPVIRYDLQDGYMEISPGLHGMAQSQDYDIVLMAIDDLVELVNSWRQGRGPKPGPDFRAHISDVVRCCCYGSDGAYSEHILNALKRLSSTYVFFERTRQIKNKRLMLSEGETLIAKFKVMENVVTGDVEFIELRLADWIYREITEGKVPRVQGIQRLLPKGVPLA
jgi:hypothetical protein